MGTPTGENQAGVRMVMVQGVQEEEKLVGYMVRGPPVKIVQSDC